VLETPVTGFLGKGEPNATGHSARLEGITRQKLHSLHLGTREVVEKTTTSRKNPFWTPDD